MIWLIWLLLACALAYISEGASRSALLLIAGGLVAAWVAAYPLKGPPYWVFHALLWIAIGVAVATLSSGNLRIPALLLVVAGVLVLPARLYGGFAFGNPWLFFSDVAGVAAILFIGWPAVVDRGFGMGGRDRSGLDSGSVHFGAAQAAKVERASGIPRRE